MAQANPTVPDLVAWRCAERPDAPAIRTDDAVVTYGELDASAWSLAARLRPHVSGTDPVVALLTDRGPDFVAGMLAAWRAGCAFAPIDPATPPARISYLLDDLGARVVVTADPEPAGVDPAIALVDPTPGSSGPAVTGEGDPVDTAPVPTPDGDDIAYVLYTSGTTGAPKGVPIRHRGLANAVAWCVDELDLGPDDRASQVANVGFDAAQFEAWPCLTSGGALVPHSDPVVPTELAGWLDERGVTWSFLATPLAEALWELSAPPARMRAMLIGAAALTRHPPVLPYPVWNLYGPTECGIFATAHRLGEPIEPGADSPPVNVIGRPIPGAEVWVLDDRGERTGVGEPGEIHLGGVGIAPGYWRRPATSRRRFAEVGPDGRPGPVYATGDRGRWLPDGTLEFLGRTDRQIELRGYRIEPGEVEASLMADAVVRNAVVRAVAGRLVAYLVAADSREDTAAVLAGLGERLPAHLVPDAVVWLKDLPLTERGKVDEARLPAPERIATPAPFVPPEGELERRVAAVWARVLGVESPGSRDNFFDIGGSSLLLVRLRAELQAELDRPVPIRLLFEHPTVQAFARSLGPDGSGSDTERAQEARDRAAMAGAARARAARTGSTRGRAAPDR